MFLYTVFKVLYLLLCSLGKVQRSKALALLLHDNVIDNGSVDSNYWTFSKSLQHVLFIFCSFLNIAHLYCRFYIRLLKME
jgi:hypothetical protein